MECRVSWLLRNTFIGYAVTDVKYDVDISALAIEQYIALIPDDIKPGIVNPKIGDHVKFEINANFMRELRRKLFAGTDDEDAYEHVHTVLEIVDLFHVPGVTHDAIILRIFPITLKGRALRWKDRIPTGYINLLYQCPLHNLNCQQKVHIFYTRLDIPTRKILDSNGFIPLMTPKKALESIQVMAYHSHKWYDETTTRERINDVLDNVDAIYESFKGEHLTKECSLKKENEAIKHTDDEKMRKILENMESNIRALKTRTKNLHEKAYQLTHKVLTNKGEKVKGITTMGKENMKEPVPRDLPPTLFPGHLKEQMGIPYRTRETVQIIGNPAEIHNAKAQEDDGDIDIGWDITSNDVERLMVHVTPPDDDYVAPATNKQLNKFEEEFSNIAKVAEKEYDNPDMKTYCCETFIRKLLCQDPGARRQLSRPARLIIMCELGDKELTGRWRYRFLPNLKFQSNAQGVSCTISINRGLIQAIPTLLPPQPIGEATKASNLQRISPGVQGRSHSIYFLYLIIQNTNPIFLDYRVTLGFGSAGGLDLAYPINRLPCHDWIQWILGRITNSLPGVGTDQSPHISLNT
ncbi:hypothetical protein Tco_1264725 [Tanacetum coccineum]